MSLWVKNLYFLNIIINNIIARQQKKEMIPPATRNPTTITNTVLSYCSKQDRSELLLVLLFIILRGTDVLVEGREGGLVCCLYWSSPTSNGVCVFILWLCASIDLHFNLIIIVTDLVKSVLLLQATCLFRIAISQLAAIGSSKWFLTNLEEIN